MSTPLVATWAAAAILVSAYIAAAQPAPVPAPGTDASRKWEITDNSFLVEESFNQEAGVFQNIFTWTHSRSGEWAASFTQEWPAPGMAHQFSYTIPFSRRDGVGGVNDALLNYRYQLMEEGAGRPAISPRLSLVLPTGRESDGLGAGTAGVQVNVPASKQFGDLYLHVNGGWTWFPHPHLTSPQIAGSGIWRAAPMLNVMLEAVMQFIETAPDGIAADGRSRVFTLSPGFRRGWNVGERQVVVGAAVPFTRADGTTRAALLGYFSCELPFK